MNSLKINRFKGTILDIANEYGENFKYHINAFYDCYTKELNPQNAYMQKCSEKLSKYTPNVSSFLENASKNYKDKNLILKIMLSEELFTQKLKKETHCTAIITNKNLNAQNWDWNKKFYPFPTINEFNIKNKCKILSYGFPGLPICSGVNSFGLSLMWTGAGYYPPLKPKVGVPTYALIFELLLKKDTDSAIDFLKNTPNAGSFIFFLNDSNNNSYIIEAIPNKINVIKIETTVSFRANYFMSKEIIKASNQKLPSLNKCHSKERINKLNNFNFSNSKQKQINEIKKALSNKDVFVDDYKNMQTLDTLIADSKNRCLYYKRCSQKNWEKIVFK